MSTRHLANVTDDEWEALLALVVGWLVRLNISGSIAGDYSLYDALDDERERARHALDVWLSSRIDLGNTDQDWG